MPYSAEAYHDGTGSNPHSYGVSAATMAARWPSLDDDWIDATVRNMARAAARFSRWIKTEYGIVIPARRISRAESERRKPGFLSHAERDPARRTDPGRNFPWGQFLDDYAAFMAGAIPSTPEDDDMQLNELLGSDDLVELIRRAVWESPQGGSEFLGRKPSYFSELQRASLLMTPIGAQTIEDGRRLTHGIALQRMYNWIAALVGADQLDEQRVAELTAELTAELVIAQLPERGNLDKATVKAAFTEVLTEGVGPSVEGSQ